MDEFRFYVLDGKCVTPPPMEGSPTRVTIWKPGLFRWKPWQVPGRAILAYWLFHFLRIFRNRDYTFLLMFRGDKLVHYATAYPGYFRFPFMAQNDLQIGYVWTDPSSRGQGLAARGVDLLVEALGAQGRRFWYVVNEHNAASIRVAQKAGFTWIGSGHARRRWKIPGSSVYYLVGSRPTLNTNVAA
jgi:RimJ/RimL family protein N-acetyltransferase